MRNLLKQIIKTISTSAVIVAIVAVIAAVYTVVTQDFFTLQPMFNANFIAGGLITATGVILFIIPPILRKSQMVDHSNFGAVLMELREKRRKQAYELLFTGMGVIMIAAVVELLLWLI